MKKSKIKNMKTLLLTLAFALLSATMVKSQCQYRVDLFDSFGDGWNGSSLNVKLNGVDVLTGLTVASGSGPESHYFTVNSGDIITTAYTAGSWPQENEYYVYDSEGNQIFADGLSNTVPAATGNVGIAGCSACPTPNNLEALLIGDTYATLNWDETGSSSSWNIEWGVSGFVPGSGTLITETSTQPYPITGLTASTQYQFYVQAVCSVSETSNWAGPFSFTTGACPVSDQCVYNLNMTDAGNSWNGANISVYQNSVLLGTYTVYGGGANYETVTLCNGANIQLVWASGSYDNECVFEMTDPYGSVVYSFPQGGAPSPGTFHTFTSTCVPPTCPSPINLNVTGITDVSAIFSWTEAGTADVWNIQYGIQGFALGTGTIISETDMNPYSLTGLIPATSYSIYVQADCGADDTSFWVGPINFNMGLTALTNPSACELGYDIPDGDCQDFVIDVNGVPGTQLGADCYVKEVRLIAQHTFDSDLIFTLISPNGEEVVLSQQIGGGGDNYGIIDGTCTQFTSFKMDALISITDGTAPFVGEFIPLGDFDDFNDNSNPNGFWTLEACDQLMSDLGTLEFVEIIFGTFGTEAEILTYSFPEQTAPAIIDATAATIDIEVDWQADITNLVASFTLSLGAEAFVSGVEQISGLSANNFSGSIEYTVVAEDGATSKIWTINVSLAEMPQGAICSWPLPISLPVYGETGTTEGFGDDYDNTMTCSSNFMKGDDIVYEFTIPVDGTLSGSLTGSIGWIGMFVTQGCPDAGGSCVISKTATGTNASFTDQPITPGTYFFIISNYAPPQSYEFEFDLVFTPDPTALDLGVIFPVEDIESCSLTENEEISTCIINNGGVTIEAGDTIFIGYAVEEGAEIWDTIFLTEDLAFGDSICHVFAETYDFSATGEYEVNILMQYEGDLYTANNEVLIHYINYTPNADFVGGDTILVSDFPFEIELYDIYQDYYWYNADLTNTSSLSSFEVDTFGWYYVDLTDDNNCFFTDSVFVDMASSIENNGFSGEFVLYPNPNKGEFNITYKANKTGNIELNIVDISGRIIFRKDYSKTGNIEERLEMDNISAGVYFAKIKSENDIKITKFVVDK